VLPWPARRRCRPPSAPLTPHRAHLCSSLLILTSSLLRPCWLAVRRRDVSSARRRGRHARAGRCDSHHQRALRLPCAARAGERASTARAPMRHVSSTHLVRTHARRGSHDPAACMCGGGMGRARAVPGAWRRLHLRVRHALRLVRRGLRQVPALSPQGRSPSSLCGWFAYLGASHPIMISSFATARPAPY
jgi:hypothetical protein